VIVIKNDRKTIGFFSNENMIFLKEYRFSRKWKRSIPMYNGVATYAA